MTSWKCQCSWFNKSSSLSEALWTRLTDKLKRSEKNWFVHELDITKNHTDPLEGHQCITARIASALMWVKMCTKYTWQDEIVPNSLSPPPLASFPGFLSLNFTVSLLLLSFIFFLWLEIEFEQVCRFPPLPAPLSHRYALCAVLIAWSWRHFPCHFSEIFSRPLLAAQVACYFYSLRAGSLFVSVFASFQSGANNRGWQENRGNTLLIWPIPYTLWMAFAADGAPCAVWAFSESLWLRPSTPHFERMTHYGYTMGATEPRPIWTLKHSRDENFPVNYL